MDRRAVGWLTGLALLAACAAPAPPGAAPASTASPPAPADAAAYRQQVIQGARAEGVANILLSSNWTPEALARVEDAVEREYGVRLKIQRTPTNAYAVHVATLLSEQAAGATPSYDLHQSSDNTSSVLLRADALEPLNWAALLPAGTPAEVIQGDDRLVVIYTAYVGLMYDPTVVAPGDVPRTLKDLANPRWRGKVMITQYPDLYVPYVLKSGHDDAMAMLRAIVQNGAFVGTYSDQETRFAAREVAIVMVSSLTYNTTRLQGVPSDFTVVDYAVDQAHHLSVPRRAAHPNAAKLVAAVLVGPEGQRLSAEYTGASNRYYSGSSEQRLTEQIKAAGVPAFSWWNEPGALDYLLSPSGEEVRREIGTIFKGG